jgi:hypothetical protein
MDLVTPAREDANKTSCLALFSPAGRVFALFSREI